MKKEKIFVGRHYWLIYFKLILGLSLLFMGYNSSAQWIGTNDNNRIFTEKIVGINTTNPNSNTYLNVKNGSILFEGSIGGVPVSGAGTRMMWIPSKGAFRAGKTQLEWDAAKIGSYSAATGYRTEASGYYSLATGYRTKSTSYGAVAIGAYSESSGNYALAQGFSALASGYAAIGTGYNTAAIGRYSFSMGASTKAEAQSSVAMGQFNIGGGNGSSWIETDPVFEIGIGTSDEERKNALTVLKNGSMGLGVDPVDIPDGYQLAVEGKILAENIDLRLKENWPDYVFEQDYSLMSLETLDAFITTNKHLPEVPSAEQVKNEGVSLGDMNVVLLQKIEELTLHMIDQNQKIKSLIKVNESLQSQINELSTSQLTK